MVFLFFDNEASLNMIEMIIQPIIHTTFQENEKVKYNKIQKSNQN